MKRVSLEMIVQLQIDVSTDDAQIAQEWAEAAVRARYQGSGYRIDLVMVEDIDPKEPAFRMLPPGTAGWRRA